MTSQETTLTSRREFLKTTGGVVAASALTSLAVPAVHAAGNDLIQVALIGCGGRGSGAAVDALQAKNAPIKLVAMADAYADRLNSSYSNLMNSGVKERVDVPKDRQFVGFDAYRHAIDCLKPGDVAIFATPLAFRWVHFTYAIEKKVNVFMEKPLTADGPTSKRMLKLAEAASAKNLKVGVGLMSRHARHLQELHERIQNGELGEIVLMRGYRMQGPVGAFNVGPKPANIGELEYQIRNFHSFLWASGGSYSDFNIHIIDHLSWMKNAWPVKAQSVGGRHYRVLPDGQTSVDQNFDVYATEYTFPDGSKFFFEGRCMEGAQGIYSSTIHGTKGWGVASRGGDCGAPAGIYSGLGESSTAKTIWESKDNSNPYHNEWNDLIAAIRNDKPYNEVERGVKASLVTSMGRMAAHTGQETTYDEMLNCPHEFAPGVDKLTVASPSPLLANAKGVYPIPQPGLIGKREF